MKEIPVYLFIGFLEGGKTKFIKDTIAEGQFDDGENTLLLICEEGEEEYDLSYLESSCFDTVEQADICQRIETLIDRLPANQREVLRMTAFERFDSRQISKATGQGEGNVRQLLSRGRRRLRELIDNIDKS